MTLDEISEALGEDWTPQAGYWYRKVNGMTFEVTPEYLGKRCWVDRTPEDVDQHTTLWRCPDDESAVAVAHLLVTIEQIVDGTAEVAPRNTASDTCLLDPPDARRRAVDLLRHAAKVST